MHQRKNTSNSQNGHNNNNNNNMYRSNSKYDPERATSSDLNSNILESQNNDRISELSEQVSRLKGLTIDIGNEVREQNSLLDSMNEGFGRTGDLLSSSLRRIGVMLDSGGAKHMCYMVAFVVGVMVLLYWLMKFKG